jgi:DNA-binding NarL/FixJ family response regulator
VLAATTPEQAVAVCVSNHVAAVVLDSQFVTNGWSAAQTFKMVKPQLPVVLLGHDHQQAPPQGVDAVVLNHSAILHKLNDLLNRR